MNPQAAAMIYEKWATGSDYLELIQSEIAAGVLVHIADVFDAVEVEEILKARHQWRGLHLVAVIKAPSDTNGSSSSQWHCPNCDAINETSIMGTCRTCWHCGYDPDDI